MAKAKGRDYLHQIAQQEIQEIISILSEKLGELISGAKPSPDKESEWQRLWNTAIKAAEVTPFFMVPKIVIDTISAIHQTPRIQDRANQQDSLLKSKDSGVKIQKNGGFQENQGEGKRDIGYADGKVTSRVAASGRMDETGAFSGRLYPRGSTARRVEGSAQTFLSLGVGYRKSHAVWQPGVGYDPQGSIVFEYNPDFFYEAEVKAKDNPSVAIEYTDAILQEEIIHAAHLAALREDWIKSGKAENFKKFAESEFQKVLPISAKEKRGQGLKVDKTEKCRTSRQSLLDEGNVSI